MKNRKIIIAGMICISVILLATWNFFNSKKESPVTPEHATGWIESEPEAIALFPKAELSGLEIPSTGLPAFFELDMPPVQDQGKEGSCCAFACAYAARSYLLHKDQGLPYADDTGYIDPLKLFSPEFLFNIAKEPGGMDCEKTGMKLVNALNFIKEKGVTSWSAMPYSSTNGCTTMPDTAQLQNASFFKVRKVENIAAIDVSTIKKILINRNPIVFSAKIDAGFMQLGNGVWNKTILPELDGHAMVLCGWDDTRQAYKVMNSWGTAWGENGFGWIGYAHFSKVVKGNKGLYEMFCLTNGYDSTLLPKLETTKISYAYNNYIYGGNVLSSGGAPITSCGICFDIYRNPTINDWVIDGLLENNETISCGPFDDWDSGKKYYIRAYAVNMFGISYGQEMSFYYYQPTAKISQPVPVSGFSARTKLSK
jgi:C1A family cysteine protease